MKSTTAPEALTGSETNARALVRWLMKPSRKRLASQFHSQAMLLLFGFRRACEPCHFLSALVDLAREDRTLQPQTAELLCWWAQSAWHDFENSALLKAFSATLSEAWVDPATGNRVKLALIKHLGLLKIKPMQIDSVLSPPKHSSLCLDFGQQVTSYSPEEVAKFFCWLDSGQFFCISASRVVDNLFHQHFNIVSWAIISMLVACPDEMAHRKMLSWWIKCAAACFNLWNLNSATCIMAGVTAHNVERLSQAGFLAPKARDTLVLLRELISGRHNYLTLRSIESSAIAARQSNLVPFLPFHLRDIITRCDAVDGCPNLSSVLRYGAAVGPLLRFQRRLEQPPRPTNAAMLELFEKAWPILSEEECNAKSDECQKSFARPETSVGRRGQGTFLTHSLHLLQNQTDVVSSVQRSPGRAIHGFDDIFWIESDDDDHDETDTSEENSGKQNRPKLTQWALTSGGSSLSQQAIVSSQESEENKLSPAKHRPKMTQWALGSQPPKPAERKESSAVAAKDPPSAKPARPSFSFTRIMGAMTRDAERDRMRSK